MSSDIYETMKDRLMYSYPTKYGTAMSTQDASGALEDIEDVFKYLVYGEGDEEKIGAGVGQAKAYGRFEARALDHKTLGTLFSALATLRGGLPRVNRDTALGRIPIGAISRACTNELVGYPVDEWGLGGTGIIPSRHKEFCAGAGLSVLW